ncbi:helicase POLQ-like [Spodoptera frugiperda]|uniref:Helicase POLQ-like n=1 Tax=Spodoptera frugiperda TaxID=7108 RepID=A0A9R0F3N7_SPOFR|nr:helicase POLQ-like [Spodoptera frugiperda]
MTMASLDNIKDTSTPKRRRMGTGRIFRSSLNKSKQNNDLLMGFSPVMIPKHNDVENNAPDRCDSPLLPCNQVEFRSICDSENNSSICDIPPSPDVLPASVGNEWESLNICTSHINEIDEISTEDRNNQVLSEFIEDISDDMFQSKLEQSHIKEIDKKFTDNIEKSFDMVNQSISNLDEVMKSKSLLFETRDSFLLDVKEDPTQHIQSNQNVKKKEEVKVENTFYGLPMIAKGLFKTYRNIEKFYEWQEECLNLEAIRERRNLIYALPTSGGKTLVAEVLMLREVLNRKKNALFILPFVAIVQEKIWALSTFAVQLDFLVEEYAAGKGHIPPKKRRKKNSIYIATIEKGLALIRSLIELDRLHEIGLIVVDELHLIGESGRGGTLETLLTTVIFTNKDIQIVGMSATIGNLHEIAQFLRADVFQRQFRPVELTEYVKLGDMLHKIVWGSEGVEIVPDRALSYNYSAAATSLDPDLIGGLVSEVVPKGSVLVFCPTKRNCENVTTLLCKLQRREMVSHKAAERQALESALRAEGANSDLAQAVRYGIAYHHAGLASDERSLLEQAYRSGTISVLCCTSTLAAGVNLPAQRVIVRAPHVGREFLTLGAYRQMVGRAGRAGVCDTGESIVICGASVWPQLQTVLRGGLAAARSALRRGAQGPGGPPSGALSGLLLSGVALRLACTRARMRDFLACTLLAVTGDDSCSPSDINSILDETLRSLLQSGAIEVVRGERGQASRGEGDTSHVAVQECRVYNDTQLAVSALGSAAIKACMDLTAAEQFLVDLDQASKSLVVMGSLHLLYLVTPQDAASIKPDYAHYYSLYSALDEEGIQTAKVLGITEQNAIRMMTGKPITNVSEKVLCRFYLAMMLHDLWKQVPFPAVAHKYNIPRGTVQSVLSSASSAAVSGARLCAALESRWAGAALLAELAPRLQHAAAPELTQLMDLPNVKKARALQLSRAGYKRVEDVARAAVDDLTAAVAHLSRTAAAQLVSAARMILIEKVENLRAEAEDVMDELNS